MSEPETTEIEVLEPGFLTIRFHGKLTASEASAILDAIELEASGKSYFVLAAFMDDIDGATPEARRVTAERLKQLPDRAIAIVGGSFAQRMVAKLVLIAIKMLGTTDRNVAKFFSDGDSAREWLQEYARSRAAR